MTDDLASIGLSFPQWEQAVEAAIQSGLLTVTGELRGGQLINFTDPSGAQMNILAAEPFATWAGFDSTTVANAHISMVNDVLAFCEIIDDSGQPLAAVTCNLAQGPLLVEEPVMPWQQLKLTGMGLDYELFDNEEAFEAAKGGRAGLVVSRGAAIIAAADGSEAPDAQATVTAVITGADYRTTELTGQRFIHLDIDAAIPMDVVVKDADELPKPGQVIAGTVMLTGLIEAPQGCGGGSKVGTGGCGCGGGGCCGG